MRIFRLSERSRANRLLSFLTERCPHKSRYTPRRRCVVAILASVCAISLCFLPANAPAGIDEVADAIEQVFADAINGMLSTDFEPQTIHFAYKPPAVDSVHVDVTVIGYAFCDPPDYWANPNPTPTFPFNAYGCENVATVSATVSPDATSSDIVIDIVDFFLDLEYERDETAACLECDLPFMPPCGTVPGEGYLLTSGTVTATLALERVGTCVQTTIVPGSVKATLVPKDRGLRRTSPSVIDDTCMESGWDLFATALFDLLNQSASEGLEAALVDEIASINQALCALTPVEKSTWGEIKSLYR